LEFPLLTRDRRGDVVKLEEKDWIHIALKHEEVGDDPLRLLSYVQDSDEIYLDKEGIIHYIHLFSSKYFIVVICGIEKGESYIRTAYIINARRKKRRYGRLQRLEIS